MICIRLIDDLYTIDRRFVNDCQTICIRLLNFKKNGAIQHVVFEAQFYKFHQISSMKGGKNMKLQRTVSYIVCRNFNLSYLQWELNQSPCAPHSLHFTTEPSDILVLGSQVSCNISSLTNRTAIILQLCCNHIVIILQSQCVVQKFFKFSKIYD